MTPQDFCSRLSGPLLFLIPHQDDEVLGCGGLIALLPDKDRLYLAFATDGASFPQPLIPQQGPRDPHLATIREGESRKALGGLGVPQENISFLRYPDTRLRQHLPALELDIVELVERLRPRAVFAPFEYDRHPDHLALHDATVHALQQCEAGSQLIEYMVYIRWPILRNADIRESICPEQAVVVNVESVLPEKRRALDCYASQFTCFYPWQQRPGVLRSMIDESYAVPQETFIVRRKGKPIFIRKRWRHELAHLVQRYVEWPLTWQKKRWEARLTHWRRRGLP